jgi:hypothetical protein
VWCVCVCVCVSACVGGGSEGGIKSHPRRPAQGMGTCSKLVKYHNTANLKGFRPSFSG